MVGLSEKQFKGKMIDLGEQFAFVNSSLRVNP